MLQIDPKFSKFNTIISSLCAEARRDIWLVDSSAIFEIDGVIHGKHNKTELPAIKSQIASISQLSSYNYDQENQQESQQESQQIPINDSLAITALVTQTDKFLNEYDEATSDSPFS